MTKFVVETTGPFQLVGLTPEHFIRANRPSVVPAHNSVDQHVSGGRVRVLGPVDDSTTDADLAFHLAEDGTIEDFLVAYAPSDEDKPVKAKGRKAAAE